MSEINNDVKYAMIRRMREIKDQIAQRDEAIPRLQLQLSDARGERLELIDRLDQMERFSEDHGLGITAKDIAPVVLENAETPSQAVRRRVADGLDLSEDDDEDPF